MATNHRTQTPFQLNACKLAALVFCTTLAPAWSQPMPEGTLPAVTVKPSASPTLLSTSGFGETDPDQTPLSVRGLAAQDLVDHHVRRLSDVLQLDASASDSYNAIGYWDYVTLRGFVLDQGQNYRRDGLPISMETALSLENRESIELLKGISGIQAGTSAPGGLVNHIVKRPTEKDLRSIRLEVNSHGNKLAHVDLGGRIGDSRQFGYRLNAASEDLSNHVPGADGHRNLASLAADWRLDAANILEAEIEYSRRKQPSVPGLSLTGGALPSADPFININSQPWSRAGDMRGTTGSLRYTHVVDTNLDWTLHAASQHLRTDDFLAYPYGCYDAKADRYFADRYCPNGDFDLYDFRSLNEKRRADSLEWRMRAEYPIGATKHHWTAGVMRSRYNESGQSQADNNASTGTGNLYTLPTVPADPTFSDPYTNLHNTSTEWFAMNRVVWSDQLSTWLGARHTQLDRTSVRTDGSRYTRYQQVFTTPWLGVAWQYAPETLIYASTGQGVESRVAPGRSRYTNAGQALPAMRSRQLEFGTKHAWTSGRLEAALFHIVRPRASDAGSCDVPGSCTLQMDGDDRHVGLELTGKQRFGSTEAHIGAMWLNAKRRNSVVAPELNGNAPTNVPSRVLRAGLRTQLAQIPGLSLHALVSAESSRNVLPDGSIKLPGWARLDAGLTYQTRTAQGVQTWRLTVQNLNNRRFFREAPYQYSHVYLFPAAPRTVYMGMEWTL